MVGQWKCRAALTQGHSKSSMQFFPVFVRLGKIWRGSINEKGYDLGISYGPMSILWTQKVESSC